MSDAYDNMGIYGGDDGLSFAVEPRIYETACAEWGMKLTCNVTHPGKNVSFLARIFGPEVWHGDDNSMCDLGRQLPKLHLTVKEPMTIQQSRDKLCEKLGAFRLTDRNTPVFKELFNNPVFQSLPYVKSDAWWAQYPENVQFPNKFSGWMVDVLKEHIPSFDYVGWTSYVLQLNNAFDLLTAPVFGILAGEEVALGPIKVTGPPAGENIEINGELRSTKRRRPFERDQDTTIPRDSGTTGLRLGPLPPKPTNLSSGLHLPQLECPRTPAPAVGRAAAKSANKTEGKGEQGKEKRKQEVSKSEVGGQTETSKKKNNNRRRKNGKKKERKQNPGPNSDNRK